ncbi:MAG: ABC transporter permease [Blastocatellia bacterium]
MGTLFQDLRYSIRALSKRPGFTAIAIFTLALGIGANTAIFSVINAALLRPLPFTEENRLVVLQQTRVEEPEKDRGASYLNFVDWKTESRSFENMAIIGADESTLLNEGEPARVHGAIVSADFFKTLGIAPKLGRDFTPDDDLPGASDGQNSVMLSDSCWQSRFGGDLQIIGRSINLEGSPFTVIAVLPPGIIPLQKEPVDYWATVAVNGSISKQGAANASRGYSPYFGIIARLKSGVTLEQAKAELESVTAGMREKYRDTNARLGVSVTPLRELVTNDAGRLLWLLLGIVGAVLLIACANVANLLLARAATRQREIAIRAALGASVRHILQQLIGESLMLSLAGGLAGLLLSMWLVDGLISLLPKEIPRIAGLEPDWRVLLFTFGAAIITGILCGLAPALASARVDLSCALKEGGRSRQGAVLSGRLRNALVIGEIAVALILLTGAGLLVKSLIRLQQVKPGFETGNILTAQMVLPASRYLDDQMNPERINAFLNSLTEQIKDTPGVRDVSYAQSVPLTSIENSTRFDTPARPFPKGQQPSAELRFIGIDYFKTLNIPQLDGRDFTPRDNPQSPSVVIINEAFAGEYFKDENPLGKKLKLGWGGDDPKEIIGVVGNVRHRSLSDDARPEMYVPQAQFANAGITLLVRSNIKSESVIATVKNAVYALDPELPLTEIKTLDEYRADSIALPRFNTFLLSLFAGLALLLTVVGLYGVMSYTVTQRTHEIGIRMALGASARDVLKLIIGQAMQMAFIGVGLGLVASFFLTRLMSSLLYGVSATDPVTFTVISLLLAGVALGACFIPARRATKIDPMVALKYE